MKILFVTPEIPSSYGGGRQRMFFMMKYLSNLGAEIHLLSLADKSSRIEEIRDWCKDLHLVEKKESFKDKAKNLVFFRAYTFFPGFKKVLSEFNLSHFDLIHVQKFQIAEYFKNVKDVPVVIDLWACGLSGSWYEFVYEKNFLRKLIKLSRIPKFYLADIRYYNSFKYFFVVSKEAKEYILRRYPQKKVYIVPSGIESEKFSLDPVDLEKEKHNLVFSGDMSFFQNIDTVRYFAKKIFPLIKKRIKDAKFFIVGKEPVKEVISLAKKDPAIVVTGFVKDMSEYLRNASIFAAPIRTGSGIRTKILEAMACALPVVTTERAKEGLEAENGKNLLIAKTAVEFANHVVDLLNHPQKRVEMGQAGKRLVQEKFQWEKIGKNIMTFYQDILKDFQYR